MIYAGGGIVPSGCEQALLRLARKNSIPVALTLMGLGSFPPDDPLYLGMLGMHGAASTNLVLDKADLVLALGVRFDDRATGAVRAFCSNASIIHVDIDDAEIHKIKRADLSVVGDAGRAIEGILPSVIEDSRPGWHERIREIRSGFPALPDGSDENLRPISVIRTVEELRRLRSPSSARTWASTRCGWLRLTLLLLPAPSSRPAASAPWDSDFLLP